MLTELVQVLSSVKNTTDIVKSISEYSQEIKDEQKYSEFMSYISRLKLELAQTEDTLSKQIRESTKLEERISQLEKENQELKTPSITLIKKGKLHYAEDGGDPVCPNCYKNQYKVLNMSNLDDMVFTCPECQLKIIDL
jgi:predicted nuclease with TOPRIM domain